MYWVRDMGTRLLDDAQRRRVRAGQMLLARQTPARSAHAEQVAQQAQYTWKAMLDERASTRCA
jgi:hypothetical protein